MFTEELRLTHFHNSMCIISVSSLNDFVLDITVFLVTPLLYVTISFPILYKYITSVNMFTFEKTIVKGQKGSECG